MGESSEYKPGILDKFIGPRTAELIKNRTAENELAVVEAVGEILMPATAAMLRRKKENTGSDEAPTTLLMAGVMGIEVGFLIATIATGDPYLWLTKIGSVPIAKLFGEVAAELSYPKTATNNEQ